jgi:hypothetical protein
MFGVEFDPNEQFAMRVLCTVEYDKPPFGRGRGLASTVLNVSTKTDIFDAIEFARADIEQKLQDKEKYGSPPLVQACSVLDVTIGRSARGIYI